MFYTFLLSFKSGFFVCFGEAIVKALPSITRYPQISPATKWYIILNKCPGSNLNQ